VRQDRAARAVDAATAVATSLGLRVEDVDVLHDANALTLRLLPCDVVARVSVGPVEQAQRELDLGLALSAVAPVGAPDPRVPARAHVHDEFVVTLWAHLPTAGGEVFPADYAQALRALHAGTRNLTVEVPHVTDRVAVARGLLSDPARTPELPHVQRAVLLDALAGATARLVRAGRREQLLHGEPHAGNLVATPAGPRFVDLETCCRGPVEFDVAHAPEEVADHYPGLDPAVLHASRVLVMAMITTWRWDRDDSLPDRERLVREWFAELEVLLARRV
jgi:hypothetical protein